MAAADAAQVGEIERRAPGISVDAVVDADEPPRHDVEPGLLVDLAADGFAGVLAALEEPARQVPGTPKRLDRALKDEEVLALLDEAHHRHRRVLVVDEVAAEA